MDILNADLQLKNNASTRTKSKSHVTEEDEASFHFIAFVPVEGKVWKLDGLERQPQKLSKEVADWTLLAAPEIQSRMAQYEEGQIEFAVLSLVKDPISNLLTALTENVKSGAVILSHLDNINPAWMDEATLPLDCEALRARFMLKSHEHYGIDQMETNPAIGTNLVLEELCAQDVPQLVTKLQGLVEDQAMLKSSVKSEREANRLEEEQATSRRNDQGQLAKGLLEVIDRMEKMDLFLNGI
ncbi:MAG: hypothetical protein Q9167_000027 [Letrouitia subvulpina]